MLQRPPGSPLFPYTTLFRSLGITTSNDNADGGVGGVKLSNGVAGLSVGGGRDGAGVHDDDVGCCGRGGRGAAAVERSEERRVGKECRARWARVGGEEMIRGE